MKNLIDDIRKVYDILEGDLSCKVFSTMLDFIIYRKYDELEECLDGDNYEMYNLTNKLNILTAEFSFN